MSVEFIYKYAIYASFFNHNVTWIEHDTLKQIRHDMQAMIPTHPQTVLKLSSHVWHSEFLDANKVNCV